MPVISDYYIIDDPPAPSDELTYKYVKGQGWVAGYWREDIWTDYTWTDYIAPLEYTVDWAALGRRVDELALRTLVPQQFPRRTREERIEEREAGLRRELAANMQVRARYFWPIDE